LGDYSLPALGSTLVMQGDRLYSGGRVYRWQQSGAPVLLADMTALDTVVASAARDGEFMLAGALAGAGYVQPSAETDNGWALRQLGAPFTTLVDSVAFSATQDFVLERDTGLLHRYLPGGNTPAQTVSHASRLPSLLHSTEHFLIAVAGDSLLIHDPEDLNVQTVFTVLPGDNIVSLSSHGDVL